MCSLVPELVKMMALTATATTSTRTFVSHAWNGETIGSHTSSKQAEHCHTLGMVKPSVVIQAPNRLNIKYSIDPKSVTFVEMFASIVEDVRQHRTKATRTIIYCQILMTFAL